MKIPLSAADLKDIGAALEPIETLDAITRSSIIGRIEVLRPGGDEVIGHFAPAEGFGDDDGWYGFYAGSEISETGA
jgi:hypothetical protein